MRIAFIILLVSIPLFCKCQLTKFGEEEKVVRLDKEQKYRTFKDLIGKPKLKLAGSAIYLHSNARRLERVGGFVPNRGKIFNAGLGVEQPIGRHFILSITMLLHHVNVQSEGHTKNFREEVRENGFVAYYLVSGEGTLHARGLFSQLDLALKIKPFKKFPNSYAILGLSPQWNLNGKLIWSTNYMRKFLTTPDYKIITRVDDVIGELVTEEEFDRLIPNLLVGIGREFGQNSLFARLGINDIDTAKFGGFVSVIYGITYERSIF